MNETVEMDDTADCCAIYMVKLPDDIKDIVRIKHCLRLNLSTGALVRALKREQPVLLVPRINKCKLHILMKGYEYLLDYLRLK